MYLIDDAPTTRKDYEPGCRPGHCSKQVNFNNLVTIELP